LARREKLNGSALHSKSSNPPNWDIAPRVAAKRDESREDEGHDLTKWNNVNPRKAAKKTDYIVLRLGKRACWQEDSNEEGRNEAEGQTSLPRYRGLNGRKKDRKG